MFQLVQGRGVQKGNSLAAYCFIRNWQHANNFLSKKSMLFMQEKISAYGTTRTKNKDHGAADMSLA